VHAHAHRMNPPFLVCIKYCHCVAFHLLVYSKKGPLGARPGQGAPRQQQKHKRDQGCNQANNGPRGLTDGGRATEPLTV
jgi:hypothetical protein